MSPITQPGIWPARLNEVADAQATPGKSLASVCLADVVALAATRLGFSSQDVGNVFALSVPEVSKCFGPNNPDRNRVMKQPMPLALARQVALVLCEQTGLLVAGPDAERHALAEVMRSMSDYLRVMGQR
jgi:hypothetical protein